MSRTTLYNPAFVRQLFDEMAATYGVVNLISSLGFARRWRRQCARAVTADLGSTVLDLMTGMGELCPDLQSIVGKGGRVIGLDISSAMVTQAHRRRSPGTAYVQADALRCPLADNSVDYVFSSFGLKTLTSQQLNSLAAETARVLRPGGGFSFLEISVPPMALLRVPYLAYLRYGIPLIGWACLGNPANYRLLARYTENFGDCTTVGSEFSESGLSVKYSSYFFGCATGVSGSKPASNT